MPRRLLLISLAYALAATAARAIRLPNDFAEAHWLLDYRYGFIRRGLLGSVVGLGIRSGLFTPTASLIDAAACVVFAALCAALLAIAWRTLDGCRWTPGVFLAVAAILTSPFVVTAAHLMGYLDHPIILLTFAAIWLVNRDRFAAAGIAGAAATLIHESFVLVGLPIVAFATFVRVTKSRAGLMPAILTLGPPSVAFGLIVYADVFWIDHALLRQQLVRRLSRFPFIAGDMNLFVPEWLTTTTIQNVREEAHRFPYRLTDPEFVRRVLPAAAVVWLTATMRIAPARRVVWGGLAATAIVAPLVLHVAAWDTARIWSYPLMAAFGCLWIAAESREDAAGRSPWLAGFACAAIALNVFSRYPLLDNQAERFTDLQRLLLYAPFAAASAIALRTLARQTDRLPGSSSAPKARPPERSGA